MKKIISIVLFSIFVYTGFFASAENYYGIFRVNTDISSGVESIETVAEKAKKKKLDFIVFSDQLLVKAEYGLPPLRNILKKSKELKSVSTFGIAEYLNRIEELNKKYPDMIAIPGVDVAPYYFWTGSPLGKDFVNHQFSEQLTVFGSSDPKFYRKMPVIHNDQWGFNLLKTTPIFLSIIGLFLILGFKQLYYADAQGNKYYYSSWLRKIFGIILIVTGFIWTLNNRPFVKAAGFSPYTHAGVLPYQKVLDYVRGKGNIGIIWSAPEAATRVKFEKVNLFTFPYLEDIENTYGHNGFAGIYADVSHAHEPGKTWDRLLLEYCEGKRKEKPVIVGESDYHGKFVPVDFIKTVIQIERTDFNRDGIIKALTNGNSYAVSKPGDREIIIENSYLSSAAKSASLGNTFEITEKDSLILHIKGKVSGAMENEKIPGGITIVANGIEIFEAVIELNNFEFNKELPMEKICPIKRGKNYIRFYIKGDGAGWILANPIFFGINFNT